MSDKSIPERLTQIEGHQERMCSDISTLTKDVKELTAALNKARGGWFALVSLTSLAGIVGGLVSKLLTK